MTATARETGDDLAAPLDFLLTSAAVGPWRRLTPNASWWRFGQALADQPGTLVRRGVELAAEVTSIATGTSDRAPSRRDRRFADPAWTGNPLLRRVVQCYLAAAETAHTLVSDCELDWRDRERV